MSECVDQSACSTAFPTTRQPRVDSQTVHFQSHPRESLLTKSSKDDPCVCPSDARKFSVTDKGCGPDSELALYYSYRTQYRSVYGQYSGIPYTRRAPPRYHESSPEQVSWKGRVFDSPMQDVRFDRGTHANNPDKGYYEWRQLMAQPGDSIWQPQERTLFWRYTGKGMALPPARVIPQNPVHQKDRWDNIKRLDAANCLSHGYRTHVSGYGGHVNVQENVETNVSRQATGENKAMESTAQASYREHPPQLYLTSGLEYANKHKGPLSKMVTLTHPFNPYTQQSAYSNMGATDTTSNSCN